MSKAGEKLIAAAKEAVVVANCEHDLAPQPIERGSSLQKFYCTKCHAMIWLTEDSK